MPLSFKIRIFLYLTGAILLLVSLYLNAFPLEPINLDIHLIPAEIHQKEIEDKLRKELEKERKEEALREEQRQEYRQWLAEQREKERREDEQKYGESSTVCFND